MDTALQAIRVLIADDHPTSRMGIRAVLDRESGIQRVGEAQDASEAMELVAELHPDILLLDLVMPGPRPHEVERWVRAKHPRTTTLVLTAHDRDCFLARMVDAGVAGFLRKDAPEATLVRAIRRAARGEILMTRAQLERVEAWRTEVAEPWQRLTAREREVLELLVEGDSAKEIGRKLVIERTTVWTHIGNIVKKLGVDSRAEAIAWAWLHKVFERMGPGA
jgi:DNA-binding NarL/FixJ family response regulator